VSLEQPSRKSTLAGHVGCARRGRDRVRGRERGHIVRRPMYCRAENHRRSRMSRHGADRDGHGLRPAAALWAAPSILHAVDHGDAAIPRRAMRRLGAGADPALGSPSLSLPAGTRPRRAHPANRRTDYGMGKLTGKHLVVPPADHGATSSRRWPCAPSLLHLPCVTLTTSKSASTCARCPPILHRNTARTVLTSAPS